METPDETPGPIYRYKATVWIARTYDVLAEDDDDLETRIHDAMLKDGLSPDDFSLVRLQASRTQTHWQ